MLIENVTNQEMNGKKKGTLRRFNKFPQKQRQNPK